MSHWFNRRQINESVRLSYLYLSHTHIQTYAFIILVQKIVLQNWITYDNHVSLINLTVNEAFSPRNRYPKTRSPSILIQFSTRLRAVNDEFLIYPARYLFRGSGYLLPRVAQQVYDGTLNKISRR